MEITVKKLEALDACSSGIEDFKKAFPDGYAPATKEEAIKLAVDAAHLDYHWAAYKEAKAPAWAAYEEVEAAAWAAYEEVEAAAWAAYEEVEAAAWAAAYWDQEEG